MMEKKFDFMYVLRIAGVLLIICALVALLLSAVNLLTKDKIAANAQARMNESIAHIFGDGISAKKMDKEFDAPISGIYEVSGEDGTLVGYAVYTVPTGFKGDIEMMVGVTLAGRCKGVEIISMSETPGSGARTGEPEFLGQFKNVTGELVLKEDIMPITGATVSSRTVTTAVNGALAAVGGIIG